MFFRFCRRDLQRGGWARLYKNRVPYQYREKSEEVPSVQKAKTLLDIDVRRVLKQIEAKYGLKLPKKVITIDYGDDVGDLYVRFQQADNTEGEATADGKVIVHYDKKGKIAAVEI